MEANQYAKVLVSVVHAGIVLRLCKATLPGYCTCRTEAKASDEAPWVVLTLAGTKPCKQSWAAFPTVLRATGAGRAREQDGHGILARSFRTSGSDEWRVAQKGPLNSWKGLEEAVMLDQRVVHCFWAAPHTAATRQNLVSANLMHRPVWHRMCGTSQEMLDTAVSVPPQVTAHWKLEATVYEGRLALGPVVSATA